MSPLEGEVYSSETGRWVKLSGLKPGEPVASMSNNRPDGNRELYYFECAPDDSKSVIYRSGEGLDVDLGSLRLSTIDQRQLEVVKELKKGETFEMEIQTDRMQTPTTIRFTHR